MTNNNNMTTGTITNAWDQNWNYHHWRYFPKTNYPTPYTNYPMTPFQPNDSSGSGWIQPTIDSHYKWWVNSQAARSFTEEEKEIGEYIKLVLNDLGFNCVPYSGLADSGFFPFAGMIERNGTIIGITAKPLINDKQTKYKLMFFVGDDDGWEARVSPPVTSWSSSTLEVSLTATSESEDIMEIDLHQPHEMALDFIRSYLIDKVVAYQSEKDEQIRQLQDVVDDCGGLMRVLENASKDNQ